MFAYLCYGDGYKPGDSSRESTRQLLLLVFSWTAMGVLRFPRPRPTGIYVPRSTTPILTTDMISPPLSPSIYGESDNVTASIIPALEYISSKLQQKLVHITLLIGRKPIPCIQRREPDNGYPRQRSRRSVMAPPIPDHIQGCPKIRTRQ